MKVLATLVATATLVLLSVSASPWFPSSSGSSLRQRRSPSPDHHDHHEHNITDIPCFFLEVGKCICEGPTDCEKIDQLYPTFLACNGTLDIPPVENEVTPDCSQPPEVLLEAVKCVAEMDATFNNCYTMVSGGN